MGPSSSILLAMFCQNPLENSFNVMDGLCFQNDSRGVPEHNTLVLHFQKKKKPTSHIFLGDWKFGLVPYLIRDL